MMRVFSVTGAAVKGFMKMLLREDTFDAFEVRGVDLSTFTRFEISGMLDKRGNEGTRDFCTWAELRPYTFDIIKGSKKPNSLKIVLSLDTAATTAIHSNAAALFINVLYENDSVTCTAAVGQKQFILDKTMDAQWDEWVGKFLRARNIMFEILT